MLLCWEAHNNGCAVTFVCGFLFIRFSQTAEGIPKLKGDGPANVDASAQSGFWSSHRRTSRGQVGDGEAENQEEDPSEDDPASDDHFTSDEESS